MAVAKVVRRDLLCQMWEHLRKNKLGHYDECQERIARYTEEGLLLLQKLLNSKLLRLSDLEACQRLYAADKRFKFVYALPRSAGFGRAIGGSLDRAMFGESCEVACDITGLLNIFMTLLDGLLDEVPELVQPHQEALFSFIASTLNEDTDLLPLSFSTHHPAVALLYSVAQAWIVMVKSAPEFKTNPVIKETFVHAVQNAMRAEYDSTTYELQKTPTSWELWTTALREKTRYPHWVQGLVPLFLRGWPENIDSTNYQALIFSIADYAGFLDDLYDLLVDCESGRWNTVSLLMHGMRPTVYTSCFDAQYRLMTHLGSQAVLNGIVAEGARLYGVINETISLTRLDDKYLSPLFADLTYVYLSE